MTTLAPCCYNQATKFIIKHKNIIYALKEETFMKKLFKISVLLLATLFATFIFTACITNGGDYNNGNGNGNGITNGDNGYDNGYDNGEDLTQEISLARLELTLQVLDVINVLTAFVEMSYTSGSLHQSLTAVSSVTPSSTSLQEQIRQMRVSRGLHVSNTTFAFSTNTFAVDLFMYIGVALGLIHSHSYNVFNYNFAIDFDRNAEFLSVFRPPLAMQQKVPYSFNLAGSIREQNKIFFTMRAPTGTIGYEFAQVQLMFNSEDDFSLKISSRLYDLQGRLAGIALWAIDSATRGDFGAIIDYHAGQPMAFRHGSLNGLEVPNNITIQERNFITDYVIGFNTQITNTINHLQQENLRRFRLINDGVLTQENQQLTKPIYAHAQHIELDFDILNILRA